MSTESLFETDTQLKDFLINTPHLRGIKKTSPIVLRILQYARAHNLFHLDTTIQTYAFYIRNGVTQIPLCKVCNSPIPNLTLGTNRLQTFCNKKCQGISQRAEDYMPPEDVEAYTNEKLFEELESRKSFTHLSKSTAWLNRLSRYIIENTNIDPLTLTSNEKVYVVKRQLKELPKCSNCSNLIKIVPHYNTAGNGRNTFMFLCSDCHTKTSSHEIAIRNCLDRLHVPYIKNSRTLMGNKKELDIYIPDKKVAIEINGLYWHSEIQNTYNKLQDCNNQNIRLLQIFTDEIEFKQNIVFYRLRNILQLVKYKIGARDCVVREIESDIKNSFLTKYHIQGPDKSQINLGLYYKNRLVSVMTFAKPRIALGYKTSLAGWELSRFASINSFYILGAAGKLFNYFVKQYNPTRVYSYCDLRWSIGMVYQKIGFKKVRTTKPNYWYCLAPNYKTRYHRFNFRKSVLKDKLKVFDPNLTEIENMHNNKHYRIFDSGHLLFEWTA